MSSSYESKANPIAAMITMSHCGGVSRPLPAPDASLGAESLAALALIVRFT